MAQGLVVAGQVRLNRAKLTKPGHAVLAGDILTVSLGQRVLVMKVVGFAERRGPSAEARLLYEDLAPGDDAPAQIRGCTRPGDLLGEAASKPLVEPK